MWITEITLYNHPPKINWKNVAEKQAIFTKNTIGYVLPSEKRYPAEWAEAYRKNRPSDISRPEMEIYEGKANSLMWLNHKEGVVFDTSGTFMRYR